MRNALTGDWFRARCASLGEQFSETFGTVWLLVAAGETLSSQRGRAVCASEAFTMPWLILVSHTASGDDLIARNSMSADSSPEIIRSVRYLVAFYASDCVLLLVAVGAIDFLLSRYKRFGSDGIFAYATRETLLVPLSRFVLHFLCTCENSKQVTSAFDLK